MSSDSRERMVRSAAALIATRGASATSFSDVLDDSQAPRGSIYHHFPEGKQELTEAAVRLVADYVATRQRTCQAATPQDVLACFIGMWREVVVRSGGTAGCAVAGTAIDASPEEPGLIDVARTAFRGWIELLAGQFVATGVDRRRAVPIATATVAALEGALILCRVERSSAPLDSVADSLAQLLLADAKRKPRRGG